MEIQDWNKYTKLYVDTVMFDNGRGQQLDNELYDFLVRIKPNVEVKHHNIFLEIANCHKKRLEFLRCAKKLNTAVKQHEDCYVKKYLEELRKMHKLGGTELINHCEQKKAGKVPSGFERYYKFQQYTIDDDYFSVQFTSSNLDIVSHKLDEKFASRDFFAMLCSKYVYSNPRLFSKLL